MNPYYLIFLAAGLVLESKTSLGCKREDKTHKNNDMVLRRTSPEAEAPVLWPSNEKKRLPGKDPDVGKM